MSDRSDKWHGTRRARELALFANKRFEVVREVSGESFKTPLGYSAKNGYEVRNVETSETFKVGKTTLKVMAEEYDAVTLPAPKKRGRPKKAQGGPIPKEVSDALLAQLASTHYGPGELKAENGNEPGAHPVSEQEPDEDDRSGSLAGPTYGNPNADEHYTP